MTMTTRSTPPLRLSDDSGQTSIEMALVIGLVSIVVVGVLSVAAQAWLSAIITSIENQLS